MIIINCLGAAPTPDPEWRQVELIETSRGVDGRLHESVSAAGRLLLQRAHISRRLFRPQCITRYLRIVSPH
jgi:hypothetical protein